MHYKRGLCFAVIFKNESQAKVKELKFATKSADDDDSDEASGVTLASCFNGYEKLETLSGND